MANKTITKPADQFYVWSKTERLGDVVEVDHEKVDPKWLIFKDGTKINKGLINEMLLPANTVEQANNISKDFGGIGTSTSNKLNTNTDVVQPAPIKVAEVKTPEVNVMMEMLKKISKKNKASMPVEINIPSKSVYEMLQDQMDLDPEELNTQIGLLVENQINNLQAQLKEQITNFITNYYENGRTNTTDPTK
jgi:mRNA deadenylase 3'-5' endonuclease subunit Ccr4